MASFRRTLSPYNARSHSNGSINNNPFSFSQSPKIMFSNSTSKPSFSPVRKFLTNIFPPKRKNYLLPSRKSIFRCLLFFFLGFLLGMAPFNNTVDDDFNDDSINNNRLDFSFQLNPPSVLSKNDIVLKPVELGVAVPNVVTHLSNNNYNNDNNYDKQLIIVTPTYGRALQAYYLNRLGQVLKLVKPPLVWIVVEMSSASSETAKVLRNMGVMYRHLVCKKNVTETDVKDRGVHQRNTAIEHIERHRLDGVVYFADDDNIYSIQLFESLRTISRFGTWPVGMLAQSKNKAILEGPVCNGSQVMGWHTNEKSKRLRRFHVDMSGFAFNSTILWDPKRWRRPTSKPIRQLDTVKEGFQETTFIEQIVEDESQMEGIPVDCDRIMNWHLHLEAGELVYPKGWILEKNLKAVIPPKREKSIS